MEVSSGNNSLDLQARKSRIRRLWRLRFLLKWLPNRRSLSRIPVLGRFGGLLRTRNYLWSFKESRVAPAILIGSIIAFLPIFGLQLLTVTLIALILKVNLPVIAGLQFVSNPLTLIPIYLANYKVGSWLLDSAGFYTVNDTATAAMINGVNSTMIGGIVLGTIFGLFLYGLYWIRVRSLETTSNIAL